ncbi:hypothetical protein DM01DRAFT_1407290 [Hesseltinella vesiculosa]|uniref:Amino acid permease/ SLC12A domain-containing protein n=1 Tax=Hesseltinella vesiculosa TaxID=101127 RepID=A0A1X2GI44_9FUNG|nr:hypothetical protein DM01DRAFT_1407290 [Hesseltinella vesiculosa]
MQEQTQDTKFVETLEIEDTGEKHEYGYEHESIHVQDAEAGPEAVDLQKGTKRSLRTRHITMIALGGSIGTGIFLNMGANIANAGPAGAFIAYVVIGFMVYCLMTCLSEMAAYIPVSGAFNHYAHRFIDPSLGFSLAWNYWLGGVTVATELAAAATIIDFWKTVMPDAAWGAIIMVIFVTFNLLSVRIYGESEYYFALIKVLMVVVFIIICIVFTTGGMGSQGPIGFKYWVTPGPWVDGPVGTVSVLLSAGFSFQGAEIVGITAGEAENPAKAVPRAINSTFWRILLFYVLTILFLGMCLPSDDPDLASDGSPTTSPFTLVFKAAGIGAGVHVVNAIVLISVLSACNSSLYVTSRVMLGLARDGHGPQWLALTNRYGAPYVAVLLSSVIGFVCCFVSIYSAKVAFVWFLNITAVSGFCSWMFIGIVQYRFRQAFVKQGRDLDDLPYKSPYFPYPSLICSVLCFAIIIGQGYTAFTPTFDAGKFVANYIGIIPFFVLYIIHKAVVRKPFVAVKDMDFETGRVKRADIDKYLAEKVDETWYQKLAYLFT